MSTTRFAVVSAAVCAAAFSVCAAATHPAASPTALAVPTALSPAPTVQTPSYLLLDHQGELCVFSEGRLLQRTGIPVSALPAADRALLGQGIPAESRQALYALLEDLAS